MNYLYCSDQIRNAELRWSDDQGVPTFALMERAADALMSAVTLEWPDVSSILICCGSGNNGGDGWLLAVKLQRLGFAVTVLSVKPPRKDTDACIAYQMAMAEAVPVVDQLKTGSGYDLIVDALLGYGLIGRVRQNILDIIKMINRSGIPVLSVDIPSGMIADKSSLPADDQIVRADSTLALIAIKPAQVTGSGGEYCGRLSLNDLGASDYFSCRDAFATQIISSKWRRYNRHVNSHKTSTGVVNLIAGSRQYGGAALMCTAGAAAAGTGTIYLHSAPENRNIVLQAQPWVIFLEHGSILSQSGVFVVGPGLGSNVKKIMPQLSASRTVQVWDADALSWLAQNPDINDQRVLTPHSGEAARLLGLTVMDVESDRYNVARELQQKYGGIVVLKGAGTIVCGSRSMAVIGAGNPGMAKAGMGDVLAGMIGGLLSKPSEYSLFSRVCQAVWMHARAGDLGIAKKHMETLTPMDLVTAVSDVWCEIDRSVGKDFEQYFDRD